jgi:AcrR family transcriptional regulator
MSHYEIPKPSKNKAETKRRLIQAVGELVKTEGFSGLKISTVAKKAEVDRKLIYRYFGGLNYLIESYVVENDYWMIFSDSMKKMISETKFANSEQLITAVLQNQFKFFLTEKDMQRLILWELSTDSPLMQSIHNVRESMAQKFLELTDLHFKDSPVNFRAIAALLVGGIYYTVLHTMFNGGNFTDIDISTEDGQTEMLKAIEQIVGWAYKEAEIK